MGYQPLPIKQSLVVVRNMKRCWLLIGVLTFVTGCVADGKNGSWDEVWKDLRGDNMQMRSSFSKMAADDGELPRPKLRD